MACSLTVSGGSSTPPISRSRHLLQCAAPLCAYYISLLVLLEQGLFDALSPLRVAETARFLSKLCIKVLAQARLRQLLEFLINFSYPFLCIFYICTEGMAALNIAVAEFYTLPEEQPDCFGNMQKDPLAGLVRGSTHVHTTALQRTGLKPSEGTPL